jgi:hypothetical protein
MAAQVRLVGRNRFIAPFRRQASINRRGPWQESRNKAIAPYDTPTPVVAQLKRLLDRK